MSKQGIIDSLHSQIIAWQNEMDNIEDMKEAAFSRIDELKEEIARENKRKSMCM